MNPEDFIGYLIRTSGRMLTNTVNQKIKELGLPITNEQVGVLFRLNLEEGITHQEIACFLYKDKTTISRIIDTMERNNLIVRIPSSEDKRTKLLYMTKHGKEILAKMICLAKGIGEMAIDGIDPDELEVCKKVLKSIRINLENNAKNIVDNTTN